MSAADEDDDGAFQQRLTDAASAPKVQTTAPNSVFAMGGSQVPQSKPLRPIRGMAARAVLAIDACGPLDAGQIAEALGITRQQAHNIGHHGVDSGYMFRNPGVDGKAPTYSLAANAKARAELTTHLAEQTPAMRGFKEWLTKKGEASAEGRVPVAKRAARATVPTQRQESAPAPVAAPAQIDAQAALRYAMFNDGTLRIEVGDSSLTLPPVQARELLAYAARVSKAIGGPVVG